MGLADGDLSRFRRSWTYHHAGHLDDPDHSWRYPPLMTVAGALGLSPLPAPAVDDGWGERSHGYYGGQTRHGRAEWREAGGWDGWYGRDAWGGRGWYQGQGNGYDTGSDDASRGSRRLRSPSRRPRRPRDSGPEGPRSDGRGGSRRRCLSSARTGGGGSAFACNLRLALLGGVINVDDECLVGLHDSRGYPRCGIITRGGWLRRFEQTLDMRGPVAGPGGPLHGSPSAPGDGRLAGGSREHCGLSPSGAPDQSVTGGPPLLAITMPDWGVTPGPPVPIPWANGTASTARFLTQMSLMIAPPMED